MASAELSRIARHAGTILVGQLAVMAFGVTDTLVAGRHSDAALAALSVGSALYISVYVGLMGVLQALLPVWAELRGGGRGHEIGRSVRQSLYLAAACALLGCGALLAPAPLLRWADVPPAMRAEVQDYLAVLAMALPPALLFRLYSTLNQALARPLFVTWLQVIGLVLKVPLSIWFTFGGAGLPASGAVGCAWATLVVNYAMLAVAWWMLHSQPLYAELAIRARIEAPDWRRLAEFLRLGVPAGLAVLVEVSSFTLMALMIARLGTVASAGHQIAASMTAVLYMVPLSLGLATSARVSWWRGQDDAGRARASLRTGLALAAGMALLLAGTVALLRGPIAALYAGSPAVAAVAASLLGWVALYHLADAVQAVCVFILRSYRVTLVPLLVYGLLLWGVGLYGGQLLAYRGLGPWPALQSPAAFWMAGAAALGTTAAVFLLLLWRLTRAR
ncbi:MATE family efflux transporter [Pseudorhodoferax sp. Leaf265]|jgi:MATE family multidrug resistance protein|uniref:MATE family efflux transporter n=1 Tax=Pseudorhodoferax sp. Leaf265 TaxID=1736315 RepID=UPI0006F62817|nr:MATE family efflux transporter [Pseudorhodoferax sp. Leaf265]KQP02189.1 MATE family efflux transporter [Pseudorhodoferax sp. Leaf265]PZP99928.1 MAG: MATE family efflux transporter [Variovorax paradoxus]PZQ12133.1 MAG: MATE family efflux transporter [Variovorax paradoxus]